MVAFRSLKNRREMNQVSYQQLLNVVSGMIGMSYGNISFNKEKIKKSSLEEVMSELTSER